MTRKIVYGPAGDSLFLPLLMIVLIPLTRFLQIVKLILLVAVTLLIRHHYDRCEMASLGLSFYPGWSPDILLSVGPGALLMICILIAELAFGQIIETKLSRE